jgi:hypothetical protein
MSVNIIGDKSNFLSKNAITRLKKDIKETDINKIDSSKYLKSGFTFKIDMVNNDINVTISKQINTNRNGVVDGIVEDVINIEPTPELSDRDKHRMEIRQQLKKQLSDSRKNRSGETKRKLMSLKRSIPTKIFDSYTNLITKYKLDNIPAPDEVINNVSKYKLQISAVMSKLGKLSDDMRVNNDIKQYFTALGEFLGIEPININETTEPRIVTTKNDSDTEDEDE